MGLTDLTAMVDLGKFIELLRGASRDSMPSMSALFLDPATEAQSGDLVKLALLFRV